MSINTDNYLSIKEELKKENVTLIAVSKMQEISSIQALYDKGQRDFGENYVNELVAKHEPLPPEIRWHFIGHLQTNKVKYIIPFVHLIHSVDSVKLLNEINKQAIKCDRVIDCLLQVHIADENTKFGLNEKALEELLDASKSLMNIRLRGLMGMGTNTEDESKIREEFKTLKHLYSRLSKERPECNTFRILSMGMSSDYKTAIEEGSTMVRIGSLLFGARNYNK